MSDGPAQHVVLEPFRERNHPPEQLDALFAHGWPAWVDADALAAEHLPSVRAAFGHLEVALLVDDVLTAAAWGVPVRWDGTVADLPGGYGDSLARSLDHADRRRGSSAANTLVVCAAQVRADATGRGLAPTLLAGLVQVGADAGLHRVVAPLRPTGKHRYPLTAVADYARWRRRDGSAFDPWIRTHERMGARVLTTTPASQVFTASTGQWEEWTGLALPATGDYVVPGAPDVLRVDVAAGTGTLREPGVWVRHR